jgi:hypothetical protein
MKRVGIVGGKIPIIGVKSARRGATGVPSDTGKISDSKATVDFCDNDFTFGI